MKHFLLGFLTALQLACYAQKPADMAIYQQKYQGRQAVILNDAETVTIDIKGGSYKIKEEVVKQTLILEKPNSFIATDRVYDSHFRRLSKLKAFTLVPNGDTYRTISVDKFVDQNDHSDGVFYDELTAKSFMYPGLQAGSITNLSYTASLTNVFMLTSFFFQWHIPAVVSQLTIKVDKRAHLKFKCYNTDSANVSFACQAKGKYNIYTWTAHDIAPSDFSNDAPDVRYYFPHILYYIDNPDPADSISANATGINAFYNYYYKLIEHVNEQPDSSIREEVNKIIAGATSETEKAKRIYYWVQNHIKYIAFEEGLQGYVPEEASKVYNKRYGDCKGMSSLLNTMLNMAGLEAHLTWIGTRQIPYKYTDIPTTLIDNHMIVTWYNNKKPVFLDATGSYQRIGMPTSMIQGKQALVGRGEKTFSIEDVPIVNATENTETDSVHFSINGRNIVGSGITSLTGYNKVFASYKLDIKDDKALKERLLEALEKGSNKFFIDSFGIQNLANPDTALQIQYNFRVNDYCREFDGEIYINMNLDKKFNNQKFDLTKRTFPYENDFQTIDRSIAILDIPDGYKVLSMPSDKVFDNGNMKISVHYKTLKNMIVLERSVALQFLYLPVQQLASWNDAIDQLDEVYREAVVLKKEH